MFDDPKFIAAVIALIANIGALVKVYTDILRIKADRADTKESRDKDSLELHDKVLSQGFAIQQLKDAQSLTSTVVDDLRDQCGQLNSNIVKLDTNVANLTEAIREMRRQ